MVTTTRAAASNPVSAPSASVVTLEYDAPVKHYVFVPKPNKQVNIMLGHFTIEKQGIIEPACSILVLNVYLDC